MKPSIRPGLLLGLLMVAGSCGRESDSPLTIYAASSLTIPVERVAREFEATREVKVVVRTGSSGSLALAIERGAPADLFLSASEAWMDELERDGQVVAETRVEVAGNQLAVVVPATSTAVLDRPEALATVSRLAIGETSAVPAGVYTREALTRLGLWSRVSGRCVEASNVRAALALVERGEVDAGVVYLSDALSSNQVTLAFLIPADAHSPIRYSGAVLARAVHARSARQFLDALRSPSGQRAMTESGFTPGYQP